jgi:CRP-like cAMP-binding protein
VPADIQIRNGILAALLATEYRRLLPGLEHVTLRRGEAIYQADQEIADVFFPEDAVVTMVAATADRRTVEVGVIGREGVVGINIFLGGLITPDKAIVQLPGGAFRMPSRVLRREARFGTPLHRLLLDYTRAFLAVISQSVTCSQHHRIEQRLARWLLTMHAYAPSGQFVMSHQSIAAVLGARRVSVSEAAHRFREDALIDYRRGRIVVLDKVGLQQKSCECLAIIRRTYSQWRRQVPRVLAGS